MIGDLNRRRGQILGMDDTAAGKIITAEVPLSEMFGYATTVRSMSQGRATFTMEFGKYTEVPPNTSPKASSRSSHKHSRGPRCSRQRNLFVKRI